MCGIKSDNGWEDLIKVYTSTWENPFATNLACLRLSCLTLKTHLFLMIFWSFGLNPLFQYSIFFSCKCQFWCILLLVITKHCHAGKLGIYEWTWHKLLNFEMPYACAFPEEHTQLYHSQWDSWASPQQICHANSTSSVPAHSLMHDSIHQPLVLHQQDFQYCLTSPHQSLILADQPLIYPQALFSGPVSDVKALLSLFLGCWWVSYWRSWCFGSLLPSWDPETQII